MYVYKHIRSQQRHVKRTKSPQQIKRMKSFQRLCNIWSNPNFATYRPLWIDAAEGKESGFQFFMRINLVRVYNDLKYYNRPYQQPSV